MVVQYVIDKEAGVVWRMEPAKATKMNFTPEAVKSWSENLKDSLVAMFAASESVATPVVSQG